MHHASITVAPDRSAQVTIAGQSTDHPDLGSAIAQLTQSARDTATPVAVAIADGSDLRALTITADGTIASTGADSPAPQQSVAPEADTPAQPLTEPASWTQTAPVSHSSEWTSEARDDTGPSYPIGTPYSGPASPQAPASARRSDRGAPPPVPSAGTHGSAAAPQTHSGAASAAHTRTDGRGRRLRSASARATGNRREPSVRAKRSSARLTVPSTVLIALLVLAGILFFLPSFIGTPTSDASGPTQNTQAPTRAPLTLADSPTPIPGFASQPAWEVNVPQNASVTATSRGVLVVDGTELTIIDTKDGSVRYSGEYSESVTFAADTLIEGRRALVWQYARTVQALFDGESRPIAFELPENARLSSAGTSVLIRDGNALSTLSLDGLVTVPTPSPGSTPMALDGTDLISAPFDGPIVRTDIATGTDTEIELESPGDGLEIKLWKSAGHGLAISVWGDPGASANSGHRLQLVVHSLDDGAVTSINEVSSADIGEATWTRGQGYALAAIGPYLYDLETGLLVMDGTDSGMQFGEPRGTLVPGTLDGNPVVATGLLSDAPTAFSTNADLLAVTDDARFAITRAGADRITAYPAG